MLESFRLGSLVVILFIGGFRILHISLVHSLKLCFLPLEFFDVHVDLLYFFLFVMNAFFLFFYLLLQHFNLFVLLLVSELFYLLCYVFVIKLLLYLANPIVVQFLSDLGFEFVDLVSLLDHLFLLLQYLFLSVVVFFFNSINALVKVGQLEHCKLVVFEQLAEDQFLHSNLIIDLLCVHSVKDFLDLRVGIGTHLFEGQESNHHLFQVLLLLNQVFYLGAGLVFHLLDFVRLHLELLV